MNDPPVVSNSSPLIALDHIGRLDLLRQLFGTVLIPPAVTCETTPRLKLPPWITEQALTQGIEPQILRAALGPGESEAISLALELNVDWIILDDRRGRGLADILGLPVMGTLGVLLFCKSRGFLPLIRPLVDDLVNTGFHVAPDVYEEVLVGAGEAP